MKNYSVSCFYDDFKSDHREDLIGKSGTSALRIATEQGHMDIARLLLEPIGPGEVKLDNLNPKP